MGTRTPTRDTDGGPALPRCPQDIRVPEGPPWKPEGDALICLPWTCTRRRGEQASRESGLLPRCPPLAPPQLVASAALWDPQLFTTALKDEPQAHLEQVIRPLEESESQERLRTHRLGGRRGSRSWHSPCSWSEPEAASESPDGRRPGQAQGLGRRPGLGQHGAGAETVFQKQRPCPAS